VPDYTSPVGQWRLSPQLISTATTNATLVKNGPGRVHGWVVNNTNAAVRYLKLYNTAAAPTVGTTVPVMTVALAPSQVSIAQFPVGIGFETGISFALTAGVAVADVAAVGANESVVSILYR
jgi:hypothetical protein